MGVQGKCKNCKRYKRYCECGRPHAIEEKHVKKLIEAFKLGMPVAKAIAYARVKERTYYDKLKNDDTFSQEIMDAQHFATNIARQSVIKQMATDGNLALRYLERKESDEFSTKQTVDHTGRVKVDYGEEALARLGKYRKDAEEGANLRGMGSGSPDDPAGTA